MTDISRGTALPRRHHISVGGLRTLLLLAIGVFGVIASFSSAYATALTVSSTNGVFLQYINQSPSIIFGSGGEAIRYGAGSVVPNGDMGTTGFATTTNLATGNTVTRSVGFDPGPVDPNNFLGQFNISANPSSNNNPSNLAGPWTITFQNAGTTPTSVSTTLSLQGGEIPFVSSVTLSGTSAKPTFSWSPPAGTNVDGYRIDIFQNNLVSNVPPVNSGQVVAANLPPTTTSYTVQASDFTVPGFGFMSNTNYSIAIIALQKRDESITSLNNQNVRAVSFAYSSFQTLPTGSPPVNLPTVSTGPNGVKAL
jgi:hypothetical protein